MYAMTVPVEAGNVHFETPNLALKTVRELTEDELEAVFGHGCGVDAAIGALVGARIGGIYGAVAGAIIAGGFCVAGNAV